MARKKAPSPAEQNGSSKLTSQWAVGNLLACPRLFYYSNVEKLELISQPPGVLTTGLLLHKGLEVYAKTLDIETAAEALQEGIDIARSHQVGAGMEQLEKFEASTDYLDSLLRAYEASNGTVMKSIRSPKFKTVPEVAKNKDGFYGRADLLIQDGLNRLTVVDYKTTSSLNPDVLQHNKTSLQAHLYMDIFGANYFLFSFIKKPTLRRGKKESLAEFQVRVREHIAEDPKSYFAELLVEKDEKALKDAKDLLDHARSAEERMQKTKTYPKNPNSCYRYNSECEFYKLCYGPPGEADILYRRRSYHD